MDADYVDNPAFLANTSAQNESPLHGVEKAARVIDLSMNSGNTVFMCLK